MCFSSEMLQMEVLCGFTICEFSLEMEGTLSWFTICNPSLPLGSLKTIFVGRYCLWHLQWWKQQQQLTDKRAKQLECWSNVLVRVPFFFQATLLIPCLFIMTTNIKHRYYYFTHSFLSMSSSSISRSRG